MKKILYIIAAAFVVAGLCSCSDKVSGGADISGEWHLARTDILDMSDIDVYISFNGDRFEMYQKLGESRYWFYDGTYSTSGNVLTGKYSDGTLLGGSRGAGYTIEVGDGTLTLTANNGSGEISTYNRETIPAEVKAEATLPVKSSETLVPFL